MKNAILYNIITADVQTGTQSSTIKKAPLSQCQKQNKYEYNLLSIIVLPRRPTRHRSPTRHRNRHCPNPPREKGQGSPRS